MTYLRKIVANEIYFDIVRHISPIKNKITAPFPNPPQDNSKFIFPDEIIPSSAILRQIKPHPILKVVTQSTIQRQNLREISPNTNSFRAVSKEM